MADKIQNAYHSSKNIYDDVLTQDKWWSKLYIDIFWNGVDDKEIAKKVLQYIPNDFDGKILDVPVGTAVFTYKKYELLKNADIFCLDYSNDMLEQAKNRLGHLDNVRLLQGDVGNLNFGNDTFDFILSMNGFHAFPNKEKAYQEVNRVLKKDGKFIACFYIKDCSKTTDLLVKNILVKKGWFTPPFESIESLKNRLNGMYNNIDIHVEGSMVYFCCTK